MKKILCTLLATLIAVPSASIAYDTKCVIGLKRADGTVMTALLPKEDCKQASSLKKGENLKLMSPAVGFDELTSESVETEGEDFRPK